MPAMKKHKIIIVDDHQILIDGLSAILSTNNDIEIIKTYTNGLKLIDEFENL